MNGGKERGMRNEEPIFNPLIPCPYSAFRIHHSAFSSAFIIPHSAFSILFCIHHSSFRIQHFSLEAGVG